MIPVGPLFLCLSELARPTKARQAHQWRGRPTKAAGQARDVADSYQEK